MPKQKIKSPIATIYKFRALALVVLAVGIIGGAVAVVHADQYDDQINALRQKNNDTQGLVNSLASQASSYQGAINTLQVQVNAVQTQIALNQAQQAKLQAEIEQHQKDIDVKRVQLNATIKAMYLDGQITPIEQLATSNNLSDFVDKEEYRQTVQSDLNTTISQIAQLQAKLKTQKNELDTLVASQQQQRTALATAQSQQQELLAYNQQQRDQFSQQIQTNNSQIASLKKAQAVELARKYGSSGGIAGGGGYPWGNAVCIHTGSASGYCSNYDWALGGSIWNYATGGYGYRNCTDWAAWKIGAPSGLGNARDWPSNASSKYGISSSSTPTPGDAAVDTGGSYGHVMYVEAVSGDGMVVSDYNRIGDGLYRITSLTKVGDGLYRSPTGVTSRLTFVHF